MQTRVYAQHCQDIFHGRSPAKDSGMESKALQFYGILSSKDVT